MTLNFEEEVTVPFDFEYESLAREVISFTLDHENFPYESEVNLTLTDNDGIHEINKMYRQIDRPTDVLSFPDKVLEQAESYGHTPRREYAFLIVHSMLHLFGYDHMTPEEAAQMEAKQRQILEEMNITR